MRNESRTRLSLVLLLYFMGIVGVITLAPFRFVSTPDVSHVFMNGGWFDVVTNILLFLPLGFLYPLTRTSEDTSVLHVFLAGLLVSASIEMTQAFEPARYCALLDVITNAMGAAVGAVVMRAVTRRIRVNARLVGRLSLEIPLIGLIYLLLPLMLVVSLTAVDEPLRLIALVPLGFLGARLLSAVQRYHFGPPGAFTDRAMGMFGAGWMAIGTFPVVLHRPLIGVGLAVLVGLATWFESTLPAFAGGERRFETETLRSAAPYVIVYFALAAGLPLVGHVGGWHFVLGLAGSGGDPTDQMVRLLEPVASLTLLGYMLAEARGRRERPFRRMAFRLAIECACVAAISEGARGFQPELGASAVQFVLVVAAGLLGGAIYHKQRQHVRWILIHRPPTPIATNAVQTAAAAASKSGLSRFSELSRP
ncbi:MAG TPA: VanZ family protein [Gemmatimonadaceae bacterium]|nr:VanZ family protein [Gemmatimonadaceae bacterium]